MKTEKEDRRVRKTKKALRVCLAELLLQKKLQEITVKEITEKADIHRSTFYANFADIFDLYKHMEDVVIAEISNIISEDCELHPTEFYEILLKYISNNKQICQLFFNGVNTAFTNQLTALLEDKVLKYWHKQYVMTSITEETVYYAQFYLSGSLGVIGKWVASNFVYPQERLVKLLTDIDANYHFHHTN